MSQQATSADQRSARTELRHIAAYDWRRIHSATPQRNALTCRDGWALLSDPLAVILRTSRDELFAGQLTVPSRHMWLRSGSFESEPYAPLEGVRTAYSRRVRCVNFRHGQASGPSSQCHAGIGRDQCDRTSGNVSECAAAVDQL